MHRGPELEEVWYTPLGRLSDAHMAIAEDTLVLRDDRGQLFALDLATGKPRWQRRFPHEVLAGPMVFGDQVLMTAPGSILRVQRHNGDNLLAWPQAESPWTRGTTIVGDRMLAPSQDGFVEVLDPRTGKLLYRLAGHRRGVAISTAANSVMVITPDREIRTYDQLP